MLELGLVAGPFLVLNPWPAGPRDMSGQASLWRPSCWTGIRQWDTLDWTSPKPLILYYELCPPFSLRVLIIVTEIVWIPSVAPTALQSHKNWYLQPLDQNIHCAFMNVTDKYREKRVYIFFLGFQIIYIMNNVYIYFFCYMLPCILTTSGMPKTEAKIERRVSIKKKKNVKTR